MSTHPERRQQDRRRTRWMDFLFTTQAFGRRRAERRIGWDRRPRSSLAHGEMMPINNK